MKPDPIDQLRRQLAQAARNGHFNNRAGRDHLMRVNDLAHGTPRADSAEIRDVRRHCSGDMPSGDPTPLKAT